MPWSQIPLKRGTKVYLKGYHPSLVVITYNLTRRGLRAWLPHSGVSVLLSVCHGAGQLCLGQNGPAINNKSLSWSNWHALPICESGIYLQGMSQFLPNYFIYLRSSFVLTKKKRWFNWKLVKSCGLPLFLPEKTYISILRSGSYCFGKKKKKKAKKNASHQWHQAQSQNYSKHCRGKKQEILIGA